MKKPVECPHCGKETTKYERHKKNKGMIMLTCPKCKQVSSIRMEVEDA